MAWVVLFLAGLLEVGWAVLLKQSSGLTRWRPSLGFAVLMLGSVFLLSLSLRTIPLGTAYAVWTGIGAVGAAVLGVLCFNEELDVWRIVCIALIVAGIVGLKLVSPH
jgi:quaternary ammonium compound-resistance protein SugE